MSRNDMHPSGVAALGALSAPFSVTGVIQLPSGAPHREDGGNESAVKLENGGGDDAAAAAMPVGETTHRKRDRSRSSSGSPPPEDPFLRCLLAGHPSRSGDVYKL